MIHQMNLWDESFKKIKHKTKTIEMRLNDKKRSQIKAGDIIEFTNMSNGETINCLVKSILNYQSFSELYQHHDKILLGYEEHEIANSSDMLRYYSRDDIDKFGVIGINLKVIKSRNTEKWNMKKSI